MAFTPAASIGYTGVNITFSTTSGLDATPGAERRFLWVKNGGGVSTTITVAVPGTTFGQNNPDAATVITAGAEAMIGPLVAELNEPTASNQVLISVSPTTSVTGAFVDLPKPPPDLP